MAENKNNASSSEEKDKIRRDNITEGVKDAVFLDSTKDLIERHGGAVKEHIASYTGVDNELGIEYKRSLRSISKSKVNPEYKEANTKQQAGYSAEVKETANYNAENRIQGTGRRKMRTDDTGSVNDQLVDHIVIDENGNIIAKSQMKFVGRSPDAALDKLMSKDYQKYLDNDIDIEVPKDFYDGILAETDQRISSLQQQLKAVNEKGDSQAAANIQKKIDKLQKIKKNLKKSSVSNKQAEFAREHPALSALGSELNVMHRAGMAGAKSGAIIGAGASGISNIKEVINGELTPEEAVFNIAVDSASSAINGYITAFSASGISGVMHNSSSTAIRALSKTGFPGQLVTIAGDCIHALAGYFSGEITGMEALEQMGEKGFAMLSSSAFATIGQIVIPVPVLGSMIGGMLGYAFATAGYSDLLTALQEKKLAHERRLEIEKACREHIEMIRAYQKDMNEMINSYLSTNISSMQTYFGDILSSFKVGEIEKAVYSINGITMLMGQEPICQTLDELDALMNSDEAIIL